VTPLQSERMSQTNHVLLTEIHKHIVQAAHCLHQDEKADAIHSLAEAERLLLDLMALNVAPPRAPEIE